MLESSNSMRRRASVIIIAFAFTILCPVAVAAHPLGNFTINHFSRTEIGSDEVHVRYVVDMAEIPTFQELQTIKADGDAAPSHAQLHKEQLSLF